MGAPTRYESGEYPYLGDPLEDWRQSGHPGAGIVNPIDPSLDPDQKVEALRALSQENIPLVEKIPADLQQREGLEGKDSPKEPDRIQAKASRPSIRAEKTAGESSTFVIETIGRFRPGQVATARFPSRPRPRSGLCKFSPGAGPQ